MIILGKKTVKNRNIEKEYKKKKGKTEFDNIERIGKTKEDFKSKPIYKYDKQRRVKTLTALIGDKRGKILDLGCSNGHYYPFFTSLGFTDIWGVDISKKRLTVAKKRGYKTVNARAQNMPFDDDTFDVITCIDMLVHVLQPKDQANAIKEAARVLKKGGTMVYSVSNEKAYSLQASINSIMGIKRRDCSDYCRNVPLDEALSWAKDVGLEIQEVKSVFYIYPELIAVFPPLVSLFDEIFGRLGPLREYGLVSFIKVTK